MKTICIIFAIFGATLAMPSGKSWNVAPRAPVVHTYQVAAPVHRVEYVSKPVLTEYRVEGPRVTGSLYKTMDTYGQYKYGYSSSDGQAKTEHRQGDGGVSGHYSYQSPEGQTISLAYLADKDGFRPVGDHLPVAPEVPPMPAELAAAYKESNDRLAKAHEEARLRGDTESSDDGSYKAEIKPEPVYQTYVMAAPVTYTYPTKSIYQAPAAPAAPAPKPVEYKSYTYTAELAAPAPVVTYKTYAAALPTKSIYQAPAAPAAPAPKPVEYKSYTYTAELAAPAPAVTYKTYTAALPTKSVYRAPEPAPQPKPVEYKSYTYTAELAAPAPVVTYKTYSAALPTKSIYVAAPAAPAPKQVTYSSSSYSTELGAQAPLVPAYKMTYETVPQKSIFYTVPKPIEYAAETPAPPTPAPTPRPLAMKSAYAFTGNY